MLRRGSAGNHECLFWAVHEWLAPGCGPMLRTLKDRKRAHGGADSGQHHDIIDHPETAKFGAHLGNAVVDFIGNFSRRMFRDFIEFPIVQSTPTALGFAENLEQCPNDWRRLRNGMECVF